MDERVTVSSSKYSFRKTNEFAKMRALAMKAGLEEGPDIDYADAHGCFREGEMIGCVGLKVEDGVFTIETLAVDDRFRHEGIGAALVNMVEQDARERGAMGLWAVARAPGFFRALGYTESGPPLGGSPSLKGCAKCPQFGKNCSPALMFRSL